MFVKMYWVKGKLISRLHSCALNGADQQQVAGLPRKFPLTSALTALLEKRENLGHAMAQAVSLRPLTAEDRVRVWISLRGICDGQSGTGISLPPSS
jgi:hypothetical protein